MEEFDSNVEFSTIASENENPQHLPLSDEAAKTVVYDTFQMLELTH
jgi:hypothetical protein